MPWILLLFYFSDHSMFIGTVDIVVVDTCMMRSIDLWREEVCDNTKMT